MDQLLLLSVMGQALWIWLVFFAVVLALLILDLGVFHREQREIEVGESLIMSGGYISIGLLFSLWIYVQMGTDHMLDYLTGFLIEKSLSLDNIFVMALIFTSLGIPRKYQHRVLFWGIMGVIILRGIMIFAGAALVHQFAWVLYIFAGFLILTGIKLLFTKREDEEKEEIDIAKNKVILFMRRHLPLSDRLEGQKFLVRQHDAQTGKIRWFGTPLLLALISIETADVIFAVDSVPAIFTITTEPYILYTSNIFAILGLRALYFALAAIINKFVYLHYALALVLIFIGSKVFIADLLGIEKFPALISLGVTASLLVGGIAASLLKLRKSI